ncbi:MAG: class II aldolase/adducin family protein [Deltaproteobacteria bacterium]|nr:class II aldolase/adducin family protein [Deltaproteobacteria bacterium]MBM4297051.1 class II aldolase/adducin family protein [Deltaproteobacteria bacterium]
MTTVYRGPYFNSPELKEIKAKVVNACLILDREGITDGFGHVSMRIPGHDAFITIAQVSPGCASLDKLVLLDFDGNFLGGAQPAPYEWPIHACILKARPDVNSVCHTHSKWSALFSVLKRSLRPAHMYGRFLPVSGAPIYPHAGLVTSVDRGQALAQSLQDGASTLLRAHGDAVVGASVEQAVLRTVQLAFLGELAHMAAVHGGPDYLTEGELATFAGDRSFPARPWEYFLSRLGDRRV